MNALRNFTIIAFLSWLFSAPAFAGSSTITVLDAGSVSRTYDVVTDGSGHFVGMGSVCDGTAAAQCAAVKAASTAAAATDPALVVAISPNNTIAATQSGTWNVTNISGAVSLPTGAATSTNQSTEISSLATIATNTGAPLPVCSASPCTTIVGLTSNDPCAGATKTNVTINTASGTTALVTGVSAKKVYVCSLSLIVPSAVSVSLSEGSGTTCGTSNQAGVIGVATNGTAANGMALPANGGLTFGNGSGTVAVTATAADYLCLFQSGTAQIAGNLTFVQQ